jgi:hypothetical protein
VKHLKAVRAARCATSGDHREFAHTAKRRSSFATTDHLPLQAAHLARRFGLALHVAAIIAAHAFATEVRR